MTIASELNFKLYKNNILKISKNNVAYSKNFDKIVFVLDESNCYIIIDENKFEFQKDDIDSIFKLEIGTNNNAKIFLKEHNAEFPVKVEKSSIKKDNNKYTIDYLLETDDENTTLEIEL